MKVCHFKVKKIDEKTTPTSELISTLKRLAYNHKNEVLFDRYDNTILHHLLQVKENDPSKIVYKILKTAPKEVRHKLLNHENKNKKTILTLH